MAKQKAKAKATPQRQPRDTGDAPAEAQTDAPIAGSYVFDGRTVHVREDGSLSFPDDEWRQEENGITTAVPKPDRAGVLALIAARETELLAIDYDPNYRDEALATLRAFQALVEGSPVEPDGE